MTKYRIYIAGPYNPKWAKTKHDASRIAQQHVDKAIEIANALIKKGHYVYVPHLNHYIHIHYSCKGDYYHWWYEEDMTFLDNWATALFFISPSPGSDEELKSARRLKLMVFFRLDDVPNAEDEKIPTSKELGNYIAEYYCETDEEKGEKKDD